MFDSTGPDVPCSAGWYSNAPRIQSYNESKKCFYDEGFNCYITIIGFQSVGFSLVNIHDQLVVLQDFV